MKDLSRRLESIAGKLNSYKGKMTLFIVENDKDLKEKIKRHNQHTGESLTPKYVKQHFNKSETGNGSILYTSPGFDIDEFLEEALKPLRR